MNPERTPIVLVVDDNGDHCRALAETFVRAGYRVRAAADGRSALAVLTEWPADLVVTDLRMPGMTGLDLLRSIRAMSPHVPVVIITAFGEWATYLDAMDSGAVDYLNKPVRREELLAAARKALGRRGIPVPGVLSADRENARGTGA